jgi:hypothetical protein
MPPKTRSQTKMSTRADKAGGANTNKNGLQFEKETELNIIIIKETKKYIKCKINGKYFIKLSKKQFVKYFKLDKKELAHGTKEPDEVYVNEDKKIVFIIEKKFQKRSGSVCEKLQTGVFKKTFLNSKIKDYKVEYIYVLSNYLKETCQIEIKYLIDNKIPVFYGNKNNYKETISNFIINYNN